MLYVQLGIIFIFFTSIHSFTHPCFNISLSNHSLSHIHSLNFYSGQSQPDNITCSWFIHHPTPTFGSYYLFSLRVVEIDDDPTHWSNELIFQSDNQQVVPHDSHQRLWAFYAPFPVQITFRAKPPMIPSTSLNIRRFLLEWAHIDNSPNYFSCRDIDQRLPWELRCNCFDKCAVHDEFDCPICSMIKSSDSLLCRSNEIWCLPVISKFVENNTKIIDSKGVCVRREETARCSYSTRAFQCASILTYYDDHGDLLVHRSIPFDNQTLCFVIVAKEYHRIQLIVREFDNLDVFIYDGNHTQNLRSQQLGEYIVQTHIATIAIRKRPEYSNNYLSDSILNMTWSVSICPKDERPCNGRFEQKCYTKKQRCDGIWDCISGDDERGCSPLCPTTMACYDPLQIPSDHPYCYTWSERCNGNAVCNNRADERLCSNWWCNSKNGTFLCKNFNCIYEVWMCDGADDCGDNSDEENCSIHIPRRLITAAVIGATICSTLFMIALAFSCKLFHLRASSRPTSLRLLNAQVIRARQHRPASGDMRRIAPPSYNQTMRLTNENEERYAMLMENLRLAGLTDMITIAPVNSTSQLSNHRRRTQSDGSHVALLEPTAVVSSTDPSACRFDYFRSLFASNSSNTVEIAECQNSVDSRELPPAYSQDQCPGIHSDSHMESPKRATPVCTDDEMLMP